MLNQQLQHYPENTDKKYNTVNLKLNTLNGKTVDKYILLDESPNDIKGKL